MYVKVTNGAAEEYTLNQLRLANPNTSFPHVMTNERYAEWGMYPLTISDRPNYNPDTQDVEVGAISQINGAWTRGWTVTNKDTSKIAANVRSQRNQALSSSDWTQVADSPLTDAQKAEWATYRQQLRDITSQEGFPASISWPASPE